MITIKNSLSGETKEASELEHHMMIDSNDWVIVKEPKKPKAKKKAKKDKKSKK